MDGQDSAGAPPHWLELDESVHADCRVFTVRKRRFRHPFQSTEDDFFVVDSPDWAVAMAMTSAGEWVMVRQFRFGMRSLTWEFPSGCIDAGEDPAEAARRELEEESGYCGDPPIALGSVCPNPAIMDNRCHFFLFQNARPDGSVQWDPHEEIQVELRSVEQVREDAACGRIEHSLMHAGLFLYHAWLERYS